MFTNIILFMIALFVFHVNHEAASKGESLVFTLSGLGANWLVFAFYCRFRFERLLKYLQEGKYPEGAAVPSYQSLVLQVSIIALCLFGLDLYSLDLAYWLQQIPGFKNSLFLQGITAIALFGCYLATVWFFSQPAYQVVFQTRTSRRNFILSHARLNVPILIPWSATILLYDLMIFLPWPGLQQFLNSLLGSIMVLCGLMLFLVFFFLPRYIPFWWGCKPFPATEKYQELKSFLKSKGFRYRGFLRWPLFEGRMLTAGIMGIIPRYRYLLVTDSLMDILSVDELKAVLAHEMGHARYYHMLLYSAFMLAFILPLTGAATFLAFLANSPASFLSHLLGDLSGNSGISSLIVNLPVLLILLFFLRFVLGFFMRHFERQADLYSASVMGTPVHTISSLEKIAALSGKIRDLPSWHHFSIRERVAYLEKASRNHDIFKTYNRFIVFGVGIYFIVMIALGYLLNFSLPIQKWQQSYMIQYLQKKIEKEPDNIPLNHALAEVYIATEKQAEAIRIYERIISLNKGDATTLNNLAWLLVTTSSANPRDRIRALELAQKAVVLERNAVFLDTLAEAYYANGFKREAIETAQEALNLSANNSEYFKKQWERFKNEK